MEVVVVVAVIAVDFVGIDGFAFDTAGFVNID